MADNKILYNIKELNLLVFRSLVGDVSIEKKFKKIPTPSQMRIIEYILNAENDVFQRDLENILNLRRATVSGVLQTMEKNNLIIRIPCCDDARTKKIILNDVTKDIFSKHQKRIDDIESIVTSGIDTKDLALFNEVLEKMKNNIKNIK